MLKTIFAIAAFCLVFYLILRITDIILAQFDLSTSKNQGEPKNSIADRIFTPLDSVEFHAASDCAASACEVNASEVCGEATANIESLTEGIQAVIESGGAHIGKMLEGLSN